MWKVTFICLYLSSEAGASLTMDPGAWGAASTDRRVTRSARRQSPVRAVCTIKVRKDLASSS